MKLWLLPLLALSLLACSGNNGDKVFKNYQQRLARVLDTDLAAITVPPAAALAEPRDIKQALPDLRLDLTDTFTTRRCGLDTLIGERNSSLGRVYSASKQLSYELRFLSQLQRCLSLSWDNSALLSELQQVYQHKQASVHIAFNNMLLTDDTLRKQLFGVRDSLPLSDVAGQSETWQALTELSLLQQFIGEQNWQAAAAVDIEQQLQLLYQYNFIGRLQHSLRLSSHQLMQLNLMLASVKPEQLCQPRPDKQQLEILGNIFNKYFIAQVQQYTVNLERYQQQLWPLLETLYRDTPLQPALQQRFAGNYQQMRRELSQHVTWWQSLNRHCPLQLTPQG
ncbi:DUF3080 family protein [Rheinheimera maricola]|uniref:DUF3080 domain-containing protein n=1 Tax=Rheinheimera maricola TaxID=2793282 RepID=A0ABS7X8A6_9GAMM|nr:DUF3080 family protein [Rheinheimera maricola]MBZ9611778.1 DUF3080 domain-containing protein [Rheinheimera maricola]